MNMTEPQHGTPRAIRYRKDDLIIPDERIFVALHNSGLVGHLRDFEINVLLSLITVQHFEVNEFIIGLDDEALKSALMILVEGEVEVNAIVDNDPVSLHLDAPGDLARVISFVGGNMISISARIQVKRNSTVLLLQRAKLETLLHSHPSIVYCVMRNLVTHMHGVARRKNAEKEEISNYLYRTHGLY